MTTKVESEKWPADEIHIESELYECLSWEEALEKLEHAADEFYTGNQCNWFGNKVRARIAELEEFARGVLENWDCDGAGTRHHDMCRACAARRVLSKEVNGE